ncbi:ankyrin repeat domain-containing protein [Pseudoalteromonas phenolica]|uniref:Ankyrin repeat domain-containing protein n=1 Tax=Pseudoalteromonas phenolica TaxID=161398 RepID=A0A5R9Q2G1_9GAMM|nr:ankyrin repeat domain-containing protein [Pseudoalteromonas phenolica]TLX46577.1 ankyrin repeat domain-containing protein [Pseudoalteromonas phenolica]
MEKVLIWPAQYPLLLKGLAEQNGAFILDALEAWPECQTLTDEQGVESTILPPVFYLIWLKPLDPFEACHFQHIDEYEEEHRTYTEMLVSHFNQAGLDHQAIVLMLIQRLAQYSQINAQINCVSYPDFFELLSDKAMADVILWTIQNGVNLSPKQLLTCWLQDVLKEPLIALLPDCLLNLDETTQYLLAQTNTEAPVFDLLSHLIDEGEVKSLIEQALLNLITSEHVKQAELIEYIKQGARGTLVDERGKNAFMYAIEQGFVSIVEQLIDSQDLSQKDEQGNGLMHFAVLSNSSAMIALLFKHGCKAKVVNDLGQTPYRLALKHGAFIAKKTLEQHGIKELSEGEQYNKIRLVHIFVAIVCFAFPLQLSLFFSDTFDYKSESVWLFSILSIALITLSRKIKKGALYPVKRHPWSLKLLYGKAYLSTSLQIMLSLLVLFTVLTS